MNNYRNWVRLGTYTFAVDGTVRTTWWSWNLRDEPRRVASGVSGECGGSVPTCGVQTVASFLNSPTGGFRGTYSIGTDGRLTVKWTADAAGVPVGPLTEYWVLDVMPSGKVARIKSSGYHGANRPVTVPTDFSDYSATFGIGYGSNASLTSGKVPVASLLTDPEYGSTPYVGTFVTANKDRIRYIADAPGARSNFITYWCECLAQGAQCYRANNHIQSMLQILDDDGRFQGWIGTETSTHVNPRTLEPDQGYSQAYWAVLDMVAPGLR